MISKNRTNTLLALFSVILALSNTVKSDTFTLSGAVELEGTFHPSVENPIESYDTFNLGLVNEPQTSLLVDFIYDKTLIPGDSSFEPYDQCKGSCEKGDDVPIKYIPETGKEFTTQGTQVKAYMPITQDGASEKDAKSDSKVFKGTSYLITKSESWPMENGVLGLSLGSDFVQYLGKAYSGDTPGFKLAYSVQLKEGSQEVASTKLKLYGMNSPLKCSRKLS